MCVCVCLVKNALEVCKFEQRNTQFYHHRPSLPIPLLPAAVVVVVCFALLLLSGSVLPLEPPLLFFSSPRPPQPPSFWPSTVLLLLLEVVELLLLPAEAGCGAAGGVPAGTGLPPPLCGDFLSPAPSAVGDVVVVINSSSFPEASSLLSPVAAPFGGVARLSSSAVGGAATTVAAVPLFSADADCSVALGVVRSSVGGVVVVVFGLTRSVAPTMAGVVLLLLSTSGEGLGCDAGTGCGGEPEAILGLGADTAEGGPVWGEPWRWCGCGWWLILAMFVLLFTDSGDDPTAAAGW